MLTFNFAPFPTIETQRLMLRSFTRNDAQALHDIRSRIDVMRYINRPISTTVEDAEKHIDMIDDMINTNQSITWAICLAEQVEKAIGTIGYYRTNFENYRSEMGYLLHPDYWRKGIMTEAIDAATAFGFNQLKLHSIEARIDAENEASRAVLLKCGYVKEAYFKEDTYKNGMFYDSEVYSKLNNSD